MLHRIVYQEDDVVVVACGLPFYFTRQMVRDGFDGVTFTLDRGRADCPDCGDYTWPQDMVSRVIRQRFPVTFEDMLPKQVDSIFDLLDSLGCTGLILARTGEAKFSGHIQAIYTLHAQRDGNLYQWEDHSLSRLLAQAVTEMSATVPHDDQPDGVRPPIPERADSDSG